jgi:hypothetical protein
MPKSDSLLRTPCRTYFRSASNGSQAPNGTSVNSLRVLSCFTPCEMMIAYALLSCKVLQSLWLPSGLFGRPKCPPILNSLLSHRYDISGRVPALASQCCNVYLSLSLTIAACGLDFTVSSHLTQHSGSLSKHSEAVFFSFSTIYYRSCTR